MNPMICAMQPCRQRLAPVLLKGLTLFCLFLPIGTIADVQAEEGRAAAANNEGKDLMPLVIESPAFSHMGEIPLRYTCDGDDVAPQLSWLGSPQGTRSLALIVDDPDAPDPAAPKMTWVHWVLYNIPPGADGLPEAVAAGNLPARTREGVNDWKRTGYGGPCPPIGRHRYFFKLYALDAPLADLERPTKAELEAAMAGHVLEEAQLVGTYQR